jgi:phage shock protein A
LKTISIKQTCILSNKKAITELEECMDMGFLDRMSTVVQAKMNKIMDRIEDPRETLDLSYEKQLQLLQNVKRGVAEVTTSKKRLELQKAKLQMSLDKLDGQAKEAHAGGTRGSGRKALENRPLQAQSCHWTTDHGPKRPAAKLMDAGSLATKVESFRKKEPSKPVFCSRRAGKDHRVRDWHQ